MLQEVDVLLPVFGDDVISYLDYHHSLTQLLLLKLLLKY